MPIVGVNCYKQEDEELPMELFEVPETVRIQEEKLNKIKKERNNQQVQKALDSITRCCDENGNLMEVMLDSVKAYVTLGEVSRTIKKSYGTWSTPLI